MRKAIICFVRRENEVLLLLHEYSWGHVWGGVSGYIEAGEQVEEAVIREVKEEIHIDIQKENLQFLGTQGIFTIFETYQWTGTPMSMEDGILSTKWFPITDISYDKMHERSREWLPKLLK